MREKKPDRRTNRTRRSLSEALVGLIKEKRFDDITVQNVIERADVGRSTFYSHFRDKEDLFQRDWERFLDDFANAIDWKKAGSGSFIPVAYLFQHLQEYQQFYRGLVRSRKAEAVFKSGAAYLAQLIENSLTKLITDRAAVLPIPIVANYLATELFALLKWWLDQGMSYSPQQMDHIFHELVTPVVTKVLTPSSEPNTVTQLSSPH
ncbi:MAG TPA: TetR/AcrR family transcriptional regulator [Pyrinomonadaceae bacterium]|nr:TetR/AcrR family transcriptional regulator [Pyrinomonadaceae bacterium]